MTVWLRLKAQVVFYIAYFLSYLAPICRILKTASLLPFPFLAKALHLGKQPHISYFVSETLGVYCPWMPGIQETWPRRCLSILNSTVFMMPSDQSAFLPNVFILSRNLPLPTHAHTHILRGWHGRRCLLVVASCFLSPVFIHQILFFSKSWISHIV